MSPPTPSKAETRDDAIRTQPRSPRWQLWCLSSPSPEGRGPLFSLGSKPLPIGRQVAPNVGLKLADAGMSRVHCEILFDGDHFQIHDRSSRNGTFVGGRAIVRERLELGDVIRLADTVLSVEEETAGDGDWSRRIGEAGMVGASPALGACVERAQRLGEAGANLLLRGETGAGKELIAGIAHRAAGGNGALISVNCAAISRELFASELFGHEKGAFSGAESESIGLFRAASGGTLFLDEVGELAPDNQAALLRAVELKVVRPVGAVADVAAPVRIISATNRDLEDGGFRPDLYARLAESEILVPPLRARRPDLGPLLCHFLAEAGATPARFRFKGAAFEAIALHRWPRNVRQLARLARDLASTFPDGGEVTLDHLALDVAAASTGAGAPAKAPARAGEPSRRELVELLEEKRGSVVETAEALGRDRKQLYRWFKRHDIDPSDYR